MIDANSQFFAILTNVGMVKQANADALGIPWKLTEMGVGDANGTDPIPSAAQTTLINEWRRAPLNQLKIDPANPAVIIAEQVIPADEGGKWIREIGLFDADGDLVAVANCAPSFKPVLSQGSGRTQIVRMNFIVSSVGNIVLKIDPAVVLATREYVDSSIIAVLPPNKVAGTFTRVTINNRGIVQSGSNPETLGGYGITDAFTKTEIVEALKLKADKATTLAGYGINDAYTKAQLDELIAGQARVVSTPVVSGAASSQAGVAVTLTASASSLLVGGSVASFTWVLPDGTSFTTAASSGSATKSVTALGSIGTNYVVTVFATDSTGNRSAVATKVIAIVSHNAPTAPTTVTVAPTVYQNSTGNTLTASGATASDGATITYRIIQAGGVALTFSKTSGIAANEQVTFTAPSVASDTPVTISVIAVDSMGGQSASKDTVITVSAVPSVPGTPYGGGYFVGKFQLSGEAYALVMAPKSSGQTTSRYMSQTGASVAGAVSPIDGAANTAAIVASSNATQLPGPYWAKGLSIGGFNDWFIPAQLQLEMIYKNLKPGTTANDTSSGGNGYALPTTPQYTAGSPTQTALAAFKVGGAEALTESYYWSSTYNPGAAIQDRDMSNGSLNSGGRTLTTVQPIRAVRMVKL